MSSYEIIATHSLTGANKMAQFNHDIDVTFSIQNDNEDASKITNAEMLKGIEQRIRTLRASFIDNNELDSPASDCFGHIDTFDL